jgi:hypothetical protein
VGYDLREIVGLAKRCRGRPRRVSPSLRLTGKIAPLILAVERHYSMGADVRMAAAIRAGQRHAQRTEWQEGVRAPQRGFYS